MRPNLYLTGQRGSLFLEKCIQIGLIVDTANIIDYIIDSPRCGRPMQTMGVGRNEEARLVCHIDANPPPDTIK